MSGGQAEQDRSRSRERSRSRSPAASADGDSAACSASLTPPAKPPDPALPRLDHIVYEVESLQSACDVFERLTGVRPARGSRDESHDIHNALVGLGDGRYLELLARCPSDTAEHLCGATAPVTFLNVDGDKPRLAAWCCCAGTAGLCSLVAGLQAWPTKDLFPGVVALMSRLSTEGRRLTWRIAADKHQECRDGQLPLGGLVPFLIDWLSDEPGQPGHAAPGSCELVELRGLHPYPEQVRAALQGLGVDHLMIVEWGEAPRLSAVIRHPRGEMVLE